MCTRKLFKKLKRKQNLLHRVTGEYKGKSWLSPWWDLDSLWNTHLKVFTQRLAGQGPYPECGLQSWAELKRQMPPEHQHLPPFPDSGHNVDSSLRLLPQHLSGIWFINKERNQCRKLVLRSRTVTKLSMTMWFLDICRGNVGEHGTLGCFRGCYT